MPSAEASVATDRASRYLVQLCSHLNNQGRHLRQRPHMRHMRGAAPDHPPMRIQLQWDDTDATLEFDHGRCTVHAADDALVFRAETDDLDTLDHVEQLIADHLARFSRRSPLTVTWRIAETDPGDTLTEESD